MIDFHAFECGGGNFIFFPRSARLYQLSKAAAGRLSELSGRPGAVRTVAAPQALPFERADQAAICEELRELMQQELQVPPPSAPSSDQPQQGNSFQTFSLYLAQTCNMSCCYCWNRGGSFGKPPHLMERAETQLVAELIASLAESSSAGEIVVKFYGGEPLLNFAALKSITLDLRRQEARLAKNFHFTLDTNGLLMEGEAAQFLARHFVQVGVSLDGSQAVHDLQRPGASGEGTWQRIVDNVKAFPNPKVLAVRATLTARSDPYLQTFSQLAGLGVRRIQLEYCHETGRQEDPGYRQLMVAPQRQLAELREFLAYYVDAISRYRDARDIPFLSNALDSIARLKRGNRFTRPCGAGMNSLAIDSRGQLFPCIAFADRSDFAMGRVGSQGRQPLPQALAGFQVDSSLSCHRCWLRYDCAGGCYAMHYNANGHVQQPNPAYCRSMRGKAELYLHAMAQMLKKCPWHLEGWAPQD